MPQLFHPRTNFVVRVGLFGALAVLMGIAGLGYFLVQSPYMTGVGLARAQPLPFSHKQHVGGLGLDCRYCHSSVEETNVAAVPPTGTCMGCHAQVTAESPALELVRASAESDQPLAWIRVHNLADYVYFNHSIHVNKGIGCESCHGRVDQMPVMAKAQTLQMDWCLACHRAPEQFIRPVNEITTMGWRPAIDQITLGHQLIEEYGIKVHQLSDCSVCHR